MEEFIDYLLYLVLIVVIVFTGTLVFFLFKDPAMAYRLLAIFLCGLSGGIGLFVARLVRKKRLGEYYELSRELPQIRKDIQRSTKRLERHSRKIIQGQLPKIRTLCSQAEQRLKHVVEIEKALHALEKKHSSSTSLASAQIPTGTQANEGLDTSQGRYFQNIQKIKRSKLHNLQQVQEVLRVLQELNSQILALKFSEEKQILQEDITEMIDDLLLEMQSLEELT